MTSRPFAVIKYCLRPASNVLRQMKKRELEKGVWTVSAGNFSQGLASISKKLGVKCTVYLLHARIS